VDGKPTHEVVERGIAALVALEHRGASSADGTSGDGAGVLVQLPDDFFRSRAAEIRGLRGELPPAGSYAVGQVFLPRDDELREALEIEIERELVAAGLGVLGWRDVPIDPDAAGERSQAVMPTIRQLFISAGPNVADGDAFERTLWLVRRRLELTHSDDVYFSSLSARTLVLKGMLAAPFLEAFYPDLRDRRMVTSLAVVHSRFSTNTFPSWALAHPYRMMAHNGEINTLTGNLNWMRARESELSSPLLGGDLRPLTPVVPPGASDSAAFDRVLELLVLGGRSLPHAVMMMVPEAWEGGREMSAEVRDFFRYHSCLMEPWDGPASVTFTDGRILGATLDRNGLRPGRWLETNDGWVVLGSEAGAFEVAPERVVRRGRLRPGRLFIVDPERGGLLADGEREREVASRRPYGRWYRDRVVHIEDLPERDARVPRIEPLRARQLAFGYTQEDMRLIVGPMSRDGKEPTASMGIDAALPVLSDRQPSLFSFFKQRFAQVTNPAIDPVREALVMSLRTTIGAEGNLLDETPDQAHQLVMEQPVLQNSELERLRQVSHEIFRAHTLDITWPVDDGPEGLETALERLHAEADAAIARGVTLLVLSDRRTDAKSAPIPALLATSSVHHHLVRRGHRLRVGLVVESGEPREVHHVAALIGYGASAVNPYLLFESVNTAEGRGNVVAAIGKGLLKILSKMGVSTIRSYCGAQVFEAVGIADAVIERHFTGTPSSVGGIGMQEIAADALRRHARGYPEAHGLELPAYIEDDLLPSAHAELLPQGGVHQWRQDGERHMWDPRTIARLQHAVRRDGGDPVAYEDFSRYVNEENGAAGLLRGRLQFVASDPVPLDEVEPVADIVTRFATGGMSLGALSPEAHETLAIAMNRLGGRSNSGEGGEDRRRNTPDANGDERRSGIRQVASARFGVTIDYLARADQLQIKISQGSKPGEGGQLPGHKVDEYIAGLRFSTPGVELISPPPHHDIYSIEDLKQLIYDLRCANPRASVSVKLASESGVGTVAAGVVKAGADHIVIAGHDGGTGASPLSSIQAAGTPWELGLAETQQVLLRNDLRSRVAVQVDGGMRTGRDVVIGAMLGADEVGFSTAPLIATGCIMMRVCHMNTCPVGVATQDPALRKRFAGTPEHVTTYLLFVADEARRLMAELGVCTWEELIGRTELLEQGTSSGRGGALDLGRILALPELADGEPRGHAEGPVPTLDDSHDHRSLLMAARPAIERGEHVSLTRRICNSDRAVGTMLSSEIVRARGADGLPEGTIEVEFEGSAGQSFGAWLASGVTFTLAGEANDYLGKGLSGGILAMYPPPGSRYEAERNVIAGNVALYGATGGRAFIRGLVGERFGVRNSGARAVVEGVGDHGCEYMTGGCVVVLGPTGSNFGAGMTGGIAYVIDHRGRFARRCNRDTVSLERLDDDDALALHDLLSEHERRTGSELAAAALEDWDAYLPRFMAVVPAGYREAIERRRAEGEAVGA
jgi:glutamate synthase (NADPH) large chain